MENEVNTIFLEALFLTLLLCLVIIGMLKFYAASSQKKYFFFFLLIAISTLFNFVVRIIRQVFTQRMEMEDLQRKYEM